VTVGRCDGKVFGLYAGKQTNKQWCPKTDIIFNVFLVVYKFLAGCYFCDFYRAGCNSGYRGFKKKAKGIGDPDRDIPIDSSLARWVKFFSLITEDSELSAAIFVKRQFSTISQKLDNVAVPTKK
jgi:hypothetical protein